MEQGGLHAQNSKEEGEAEVEPQEQYQGHHDLNLEEVEGLLAQNSKEVGEVEEE